MSNTREKKIANLVLTDSASMMNLAQELARFIKENKLFHHIQGKSYVNVEGWQFAGARLNIYPRVEYVKDVSTPEEVRFEARVVLIDHNTGEVVGSGHSSCSNKENGKRNYQKFAIESMSQTRAVGKAFRLLLAWIIRAAGFEPTPAEEMDYLQSDSKPSRKAKKDPIEKTKEKAATPSPETSKPVAEMSEEEKAQQPATVKQKTELLLLLNNKQITSEEKNKMIEGINSMTRGRAAKAIAKTKGTIEQREAKASTTKS